MQPPPPFETLEEETMSPVTNNFAVDYSQGDNVVDINNPPKKRYVHQEFPRMVYHHTSGHVLNVKNKRELALALKKGFDLQPSPDRDYSKVKSGFVAPMKEHGEPREAALSMEDEEALKAADLEDEELDREASGEEPEGNEVNHEEEVEPRRPARIERPAAARKNATAPKKGSKGRR
jgi:hypothetical protein